VSEPGAVATGSRTQLWLLKNMLTIVATQANRSPYKYEGLRFPKALLNESFVTRLSL
jgi:hypothetical protein